MKLSIKQNIKTIFIYKGMNSLNINESINIILSPEFYWIQKAQLPVRFVFQAKKFSNSIFDGFLPEGQYEYVIKKIGDEFIFLAFDKNYLLNFLHSIGIKKEFVSKIYFTQFEDDFFKNPIDLGNQKVLISIESIATILNKNFLNTTTYPLNKNYNPSSVYAMFPTLSFISRKELLLIVIIIGITSLLNFIEGLQNSSQSQKLQKQYETFLANNTLPSSSYELDSIYNKFKIMHTMEKKKRQISSDIIKIITKNGAKILFFELNKNNLSLQIQSMSNEMSEKIKKDLAYKMKFINKNNKLEIEVNIDEN